MSRFDGNQRVPQTALMVCISCGKWWTFPRLVDEEVIAVAVKLVNGLLSNKVILILMQLSGMSSVGAYSRWTCGSQLKWWSGQMAKSKCVIDDLFDTMRGGIGWMDEKWQQQWKQVNCVLCRSFLMVSVGATMGQPPAVGLWPHGRHRLLLLSFRRVRLFDLCRVRKECPSGNGHGTRDRKPQPTCRAEFVGNLIWRIHQVPPVGLDGNSS